MTQDKTHLVQSRSDPKKVYQVVVTHDGQVFCDCEGFTYRHDCSHAEFIWKKYYASKDYQD